MGASLKAYFLSPSQRVGVALAAADADADADADAASGAAALKNERLFPSQCSGPNARCWLSQRNIEI